ncbi:MAG: nucleotidyltransferase family protein [Eubacterium sp.]|nr:nucleotidyltransferase family protein [Eubacterium sp.]
MLKTKNYEVEFLLTLIKCAIKSLPAPKPEKDINVNALFQLANKQQVYSIVLPVLEQVGILSDDELSKWNSYRLSELKKTIFVNSEREKICSQLDEQGISYMFLKGLEIRGYYPKSSMRQMSDNDILYHEENRDALVAIMKSNGYYLGAAAGISDDFYKKPFATFEFHRTLFSLEEDFHPDFDPWKNAARVENSCRYKLSREDNYIYTLCHLYKHYHCINGCGIRFLCDLYLLTHSDDKLDYDYINGTLESFGIADFNKTALGLAETLFENGECNDAQQALFDFMIEGSVYGIAKNKVQDALDSNGGSKLKYLLHRIFPPVKQMVGNYKILEKRKYLLPFYYIKRLFEKYYHNKDRLKNEIAELESANRNK